MDPRLREDDGERGPGTARRSNGKRGAGVERRWYGERGGGPDRTLEEVKHDPDAEPHPATPCTRPPQGVPRFRRRAGEAPGAEL